MWIIRFPLKVIFAPVVLIEAIYQAIRIAKIRDEYSMDDPIFLELIFLHAKRIFLTYELVIEKLVFAIQMIMLLIALVGPLILILIYYKP